MSANQATVPDSGLPQDDNAQAIDDSPGSPTSDSGLKWDKNVNDNTAQGEATRDRRMSNEWDASKTPPSRFQKRKGSIHATPASRDSHIDNSRRKPSIVKEKWYHFGGNFEPKSS